MADRRTPGGVDSVFADYWVETTKYGCCAISAPTHAVFGQSFALLVQNLVNGLIRVGTGLRFGGPGHGQAPTDGCCIIRRIWVAGEPGENCRE